MDGFCGTPIWQSNLTWDIKTSPDFTPCFQETVLAWTPCLFLLLFAPLDLISIYRSERRYIPTTLLNLFKGFLTIVLCFLSAGELIEALVANSDITLNTADYITPIIKTLTFMLVFCLQIIHRNRGAHTSGLLFTFWFILSLVAVINGRSLIRWSLADSDDYSVARWTISDMRFTLKVVSVPIILIQFVLSCIADKKAEDPFILTGDDMRRPSPENSASILSLITFLWLDPFMWLGYKRSLTQDDLYAVKPSDKTEIVSHKFEKYLMASIKEALDKKRAQTFTSNFHSSGRKLLNEEPTAKQPNGEGVNVPFLKKSRGDDRRQRRRTEDETQSQDEDIPHVGVTKIIFKTFWPSLLLASIFKLFATLLTFASPLLLSRIIEFVSNQQEPDWRGVLYAGALFLLSMTDSIFSNREQFLTNVNVMRIRTCITSAIYRKTLKLSNQGRKNYTTGQIVNLMSVDSQRVADLVQNINSLWSTPIQLTLSMVLLYQQLGIAIMTGLGVMVLNIPVNVWISNKMRVLQQCVMRHKDKRIKLLSEIFNGIKIIKIHDWEDPFKKRAEDIRAQEIKNLTAQTWYSAGITFAFTCLPFVVALASFATYVLIDPNHVLDASRVFVSLSLFNIMRVPLAVLPMLITNLSMFLVAVRRINKFLESEEVDPEAIKAIDDETSVIKIKDGSFKWERNGDRILDNINLTIPRRKLVAIVGPVGSGKSSLISAMLGDMENCDGQVMVDRGCSLAYVPQEAWILNSTFKSNIIFNKVINEDKYHRVLEACALYPDLKTLEQGDQSEIGEKGINLSGGQKQRISLARAIYADTDIYLMDDPLNAVDVHVGRHIFDKVIGSKGLLRDRTRVLVTNKLSILPEVDYIIVLKDGKISETGTYKELLNNRGLFSQLLAKYLFENSGQGNTETAEASITRELRKIEEKQARKELESTPSKEGSPKKKSMQADASSNGKGLENNRVNNLTGQEVSQVGSVGLGVHMNFARTMGINFVIALAIYIMSSAFTLSNNFWLSDWSNDAQNETLRNNTAQRDMRLGVYAGLGLGESICVIISTILLNLACLRSSELLHNRMLARVMKAPMSWFNTTPSGRIINRFSKDIDTVDVTIRFNVRILMVIASRSVTSLILISAGSAYSVILLVPVVILYFLFQIFYISTSRQLKRIESTTKSPIYSHFSETINGTSSIKAFGVSQEFILESNHRMDANNASYYAGFVAARWLAIRLEFLGFVVVLMTSLIAVLSRGSISPGIAGLTVTYSLSVTQVLSFLVRTYSDYETNVVSVERLLEYTRTPIEPEDDEEPSDPNWPSRGEITFDDVSVRYRPELDFAIKNLSFNVKASERAGFVGRTGAGKSTVTLSLFRLVEASSGRIIIDDIDIRHLNLRILRSKMSIIPQEPIMFTGTIRQNVDPTESYPDHEIWRAIDLAHLGDFLRRLPSGLDHEVSEGGSNFSVGQKQLFCLARTLLRRSKILVLDEATAAVDVETDNLIQQTIRREFKTSTILTVAHRLETIQDYDKVVVMENGTKVEEGRPSQLLSDPKSKFNTVKQE